MRETTKARLAEKVGYSPFLRLFLFSLWFRSVVILLVGGGVLFGLCLPAMWTVTPEGVYPIRRVSLIDLLRSRVQRRAAKRYAAAGRTDLALHAWLSAIVGNPGNPDLQRGFLRTALDAKPTPRLARQVAGQSAWLFQLSRTNQADVELALGVYDRLRLYHLMISLLAGFKGDLPPVLEAAYLKALFNEGDVGRFKKRWQAAEGRLPKDAELDLCCAAYSFGWGPRDQAGAAKEKLLAASGGGPFQVVANRLLLKASRQAGDVASCQVALNRLVEAKQDSLRDHCAFWRVLMENGRTREATQLVQAYLKEPTTVLEVVDFADVCARVGLSKRAVSLLENAIGTFGFSSLVCARYTALLMATQDWPALRALALKVRSHPGLPNSLTAFSYYMEGQADLGEGHRETAEASFDRISTIDTEDPDLGLALATGLIDAGLLTQALAALTRLEDQLQYRRDYWNTLSRAGLAQTNTVLVLRSSQRAFELEPTDPVAKNNYAVALLIERTNPEEALRLTTSLFSTAPEDPAVKVNHAAALAHNHRPTEARDILINVNLARLTPAQRSQYFLARFEASLQLNLTAEAWVCRDLIRLDDLYPPQRRWLEEKEKTLPPRSLVAPSSG